MNPKAELAVEEVLNLFSGVDIKYILKAFKFIGILNLPIILLHLVPLQACFEGNPFKTVPGPFKLFWRCMRSKPGYV